MDMPPVPSEEPGSRVSTSSSKAWKSALSSKLHAQAELFINLTGHEFFCSSSKKLSLLKAKMPKLGHNQHHHGRLTAQ